MPPRPPFRVAHFTDLHARQALPGTAATARCRSREPLLEQGLAEVGRLHVDLIVVTGDLVDVPAFLIDGPSKGFEVPQGEALWLEAVRQDYQIIRAQLEASGLPYRVLPGNHDHPALFAEVFHDQDDELLAGGYRWITFRDFEQVGVGMTGHPQRLGPARHLFDRVLREAEEGDSTPQIHLQHYLLHTPPTGTYPYAYAEADWLRQQIAERGQGRVRLVLSGHYHRGRPLEPEEGTVYTVGEALCDAPHRWRIYELYEASNTNTITVEHRALPPIPSGPVVFFDRDGVINDLPAYSFGPEEMRLIPGAAGAIRRLNEAGVRVVVVTSQSAIAAGYVTRAVVESVNERMQQLLAQEGARVDAIYFTMGAGEGSVLPESEKWPTTKSSIVEQAFDELPLRRDQAWIVGDRMSDIDAGREAGIPGMLVATGYGRDQAKLPEAQSVPLARDLAEACEMILAGLKQ